MRVFRPSVNLIVEASDVPQKLPIDRPVVLYIRRSTGKQVKESIQSKIQQDQATERRLRAKGFTDIRKISTDDGTSGQKLIEDRPGLKELYRMITNREVSAIACYDASRL
ncbi:MAG: recombinase family protein [Ktedonobacteraceae bacterium]